MGREAREAEEPAWRGVDGWEQTGEPNSGVTQRSNPSKPVCESSVSAISTERAHAKGQRVARSVAGP